MQLKNKKAINVILINNLLTLADRQHVRQVQELVLDTVVEQVQVHTVDERRKIMNKSTFQILQSYFF